MLKKLTVAEFLGFVIYMYSTCIAYGYTLCIWAIPTWSQYNSMIVFITYYIYVLDGDGEW